MGWVPRWAAPWQAGKGEENGERPHLTLPLPPPVCLILANSPLKKWPVLGHWRTRRLAPAGGGQGRGAHPEGSSEPSACLWPQAPCGPGLGGGLGLCAQWQTVAGAVPWETRWAR